MSNKYLYNGKELQDELGFDVYSFEMRNYDPTLGRWLQIDPKASERESPYVGMANNPLLYIDPLGDTIIIGNLSWIDKALDFIGYETDETTYVKKVKADVAQLKNDDREVAGMIEELENSPNEHKIEMPEDDGKGNRITYDQKKADKGEAQGTMIGYDPNAKADVNGKQREPRVGLAHELRHSYDSDIEVVPTDIVVGGKIQLREINAVNTENKIRKVTGDKPKTSYGGKH